VWRYPASEISACDLPVQAEKKQLTSFQIKRQILTLLGYVPVVVHARCA
jgi:hypothetical protein